MGNRTEVTAKLRRLSSRTEIPTWALKNEANKQGWHCCPQRRRWTGEEENLLREKLGAVSVNSIAKRLGRKRASVEDKAREFGLSVRISEGYTLSDLAGVFGVHKGTAKRWAERGLLGKAHQQQGSAIRVTDSNVRRFIWSYPHEYNLTRVDQIWFKSMVFGSLAAAGSECK